MVVEEVQAGQEELVRLAGLEDTLRHRADTAPVRRLELVLALRLELLLASLFSCDIIIIITLLRKPRLMSQGVPSPYRVA